ncbi:hypothetical protein DFH07DRAFT_510765 [Mycena maculata]|uniref:Uncharacterized protein n=1 Tax=Mycena maculata TaxID=230809 RepID=A0AAD7J1A8_9AGAR|nr:hypothetical protein DFH07DRAFT_510765 [Mycena maculata]
MAQRRGQAQPTKIRKTEPSEDFNFLASQQSTGSDDNASLALAQQLMASKQKKREEMEKKFFGVAKSKLANELSQAADELKSTVEATELVYSKFILDYAALEDTIRALWMEIKKEEQKLLGIAKRQRAANEELHRTTERAQIAGMTQVKEACHETRTIVRTLLPTSD